MIYHTDFFNKGNSHRKDLDKRLELITNNIDDGDTLLDIGTSGGYYSFGLRDHFKQITAIDGEQKFINECLDVQKRNNTDINFKCMNVDELLKGNDTWDCILYMSVHHHVIEQHGFNAAQDILNELSKRCNVMFFDMGQKNEKNCQMHKWWSMVPEYRSAIGLLKTMTWGTGFELHSGGLIGSSDIHGIKRWLWKLW